MKLIRWSTLLLLAVLGVTLVAPGKVPAKQSKFRARVYMSETEALNYQTRKDDRVRKITFTLSDTHLKQLRKRQRVNAYTDQYTLYKIYRPGDSEPYRYAMPIQQPGQHEYMDLMYGVNADGTIHRIDLMVYREPYGGEVRSRRFMGQFKGRSLENSEFRVNLDVIHIAGATISSKAVAAGTRKVLEILRLEGYIPR